MLHKKNFLNLIQLLFNSFPFSLIVGSLLVNINLLLFIVLGFYYLKIENIKIKLNKINTILLLFFISIIFSSFVNLKIIGYENFIKSFFLIKFFLFFLLVEILIKNKIIDLNIFFKICLLLVIFVSLDVILQFHTGKNILGWEPFEGRITGIFGSEAIAGAFIQKFFIFAIIGIFVIFEKKNKLNILLFIFVTVVAYASLVASNRMSMIIVYFTILLFFLFSKNFKKLFLIIFFVVVPIIIYSYNFNKTINYKLNEFSYSVKNMIIPLKEKNKIQPSSHLGIYYASLESFKKNIFFGNGLKSFRLTCWDLKIKNKTCATHSHNFHLEILHDSGLIGFFLISLFVFFILKNLYEVHKNSWKNFDNKAKLIFLLLLINFLIEIFPIKSTGSFFTTWNGSILWISISIINYLTLMKNKKND